MEFKMINQPKKTEGLRFTTTFPTFMDAGHAVSFGAHLWYRLPTQPPSKPLQWTVFLPPSESGRQIITTHGKSMQIPYSHPPNHGWKYLYVLIQGFDMLRRNGDKQL